MIKNAAKKLHPIVGLDASMEICGLNNDQRWKSVRVSVGVCVGGMGIIETVGNEKSTTRMRWKKSHRTAELS